MMKKRFSKREKTCQSSKLKELGHLNHFLGLEIVHNGEGIFLHQHKYSRDLLKRFGMSYCKPVLVSMELNAKLCAHEGKDLEDATVYWQLVVGLGKFWVQPEIFEGSTR